MAQIHFAVGHDGCAGPDWGLHTQPSTLLRLIPYTLLAIDAGRVHRLSLLHLPQQARPLARWQPASRWRGTLPQGLN